MKNCILILMSALWLGGCGPEVLTWDEEVLLNTGETIIVHREAAYTLSGEGGNPFKMSMHPRRWDMAIYFDYHEKQYRYDGDANINLFLLAISPQGVPSLVINPGGFNWDAGNDFNPCAAPYYGQLIPDVTGGAWSLLDNIEPWLYKLEGNLSGNISYKRIKESKFITHGEIKANYGKWYVHTQMFAHVDPEYRGDRCGRGLSIKISPRDLNSTK